MTVKALGFWDTAEKFLKERLDTACRLIYTGIDALNLAGIVDRKDPVVGKTHFTAKVIRLACSPGQALEKARKLPEAYEKSWSELFFATSELLPPVHDMLDLASKIVFHLPAKAYHYFSGVNGLALAVGRGRDGVNAFHKFAELDLSKKYNGVPGTDLATSALIKVARGVSYIVLGLLIAAAVFLGMVASPLAFTATSVCCVVFSTLSFFHDNMKGIAK